MPLWGETNHPFYGWVPIKNRISRNHQEYHEAFFEYRRATNNEIQKTAAARQLECGDLPGLLRPTAAALNAGLSGNLFSWSNRAKRLRNL